MNNIIHIIITIIIHIILITIILLLIIIIIIIIIIITIIIIIITIITTIIGTDLACEQLWTDWVHRPAAAQRLHAEHMHADEDKRHGEQPTRQLTDEWMDR